MPTPDKESYSRWESLTTVLWFLLDAAWLFEWRGFAAVMAVAAIFAAAVTLGYAERDAGGFAVALGLFGWVVMNAAWVTGDLNNLTWAVTLAKILTGGVSACLLAALLATRWTRSTLSETLARFRRLRF